MPAKRVNLRYGKKGMELLVPASADILEGQNVPAVKDTDRAVRQALAGPIGTASLQALLQAKRPSRVAITISDITRPVPNRQFLPGLLETLQEAGIRDSQVVIIIGNGMHRPCTAEEQEILLGRSLLGRIEVINHRGDLPETLVQISGEPPVRVNARFAQADFKIVTGYIEPHFMAGFSGGRKGVCPALVDLKTIERFHGYSTLADPRAENGVLEGNPCHAIALRIAQTVGVDFLFNVAITQDRQIAGIYCGDLEQAHAAGCRAVAEWMSAEIEKPYDLVITCGGGYPLDQTFYQTIKGMCTALPALAGHSTLLIAGTCEEQIGSPAYRDLLLEYSNDWRHFLSDIAARPEETRLDQWEFQMHCRVLERIGRKNLWFASDGIPPEQQTKLSVQPLLGPGTAQERVQRAIDDYLKSRPTARLAVIPEGPYTLIRAKAKQGIPRDLTAGPEHQ